MVVWECELYQHTLATIARVAESLLANNERKDEYAMHFEALDGRELLQIAERKVRYRINREQRETK